MKNYIEPAVSWMDGTAAELGHEVWLASRDKIVQYPKMSNKIPPGCIQVGEEVVKSADYFKRIISQGLQYNNFPTFVFQIQGSILFRDLLFNINKIAQWAESLRFLHSITDKFDEEQYAISSEYKDNPVYEDQFDKFMLKVQETKVTDENRVEMPYSLTSRYWISINLKDIIALLSMMKLKMPFFFNLYGQLMISEVESQCKLNLRDHLVPYIDDSLAQYFSRAKFVSGFTRVDDIVILKTKMGLLLYSQFLRQTAVTIKGLFSALSHDDSDEFATRLFYAGTELEVTYITDEQKFMRTIINRNCWFSMSDGTADNINSWSMILEPVLKAIQESNDPVREFITALPCSYKKGELGKMQLCKCKYYDDVKFRNEGLETRNLACSMLSNSVDLAKERFRKSPNRLNSLYVDLTSSLEPHNLFEELTVINATVKLD